MRHLITRLHHLLHELDYAQRRTLELRTGVAFIDPSERPVNRAHPLRQVEALESQWQLELDASPRTDEDEHPVTAGAA